MIVFWWKEPHSSGSTKLVEEARNKRMERKLKELPICIHCQRLLDISYHNSIQLTMHLAC
jgi:hypothetical protein